MSTTLLAEQMLNGLVIGSIYALMASGLTLIWGSLKMLNFAHGELYMLGGYFVYFLFTVLGLPVSLAILVAILGTMAIGLLVEKTVIARMLDKPNWETSTIVATLGISVLLQNLALQLWGERFKNIPYYVNETVSVGSFHIAAQRVMILGVSVCTILLGALLLKRTRLGMALRATAQDRDAAILMGVNVNSVYAWTFGLSAALAALAAIMLSPIFSVNPWMGSSLLLKAFIVCVLGGLGNPEGAILGGILLGTTESVTIILWSSEWQDVAAFILLLLVLWLRPSGLLGTRAR